ncbi:VOC family protein [Candidatus Clostridium stratigraminis]|uniref:VOC family protein n=1 Tax=Candidatus Clostridium stratigraminis TaxID=3381661 RepID=A0ABW8TA32_9CLOT
MIKGICLGNIAIDCTDADRLRNFYEELLGWDPCIMYDCPALRSQSGLVLLFLKADFEYVKPVWPEEITKQQKQMHFDFQVDDLPAAVLQAETLGAYKSESQFGGNYFVTMFDPEGHPFCLCAK